MRVTVARNVALLVGAATIAATVSCSPGTETTPLVAEITAPGAPVIFQTLTRTLQFTGQAREMIPDGHVVSGVPIVWSSTADGVASVSATGLVTAVSNGTAYVRAALNGRSSADDSVLVTVAQIADTSAITPGTVAMGAIGSTRQLSAAVVDSLGSPLPGSPIVTWSAAGNGATASVSATGLVTALGVGTSDTAVASVSGFVSKAPITVTQVPATILVASTGNDTLRTTGREKTFTATVRDSQLNTIAGAGVTWASLTPATATVSGAGIATALADGNTTIQATSGAAVGTKLLTVRRYSAVFDLAPPTGTITTNGGNTPFAIDARDSADVALPATWLSRNGGVATVAPSAGANIVATATGNGMTFIIVAAGTRTDSAQLTVSGQVALNMTASVTVGDFFFRSVRNLTENQAIDTIGAGGTVTWTFSTATNHSVESSGAPGFTSGPIQSGGTLQRTFANVGSYQYICLLHGNMTGRIVVR
jgi:plastocyanin